MNKNGGLAGAVVLVVLIAILIGSLWFLYQNLPGSIQELKPIGNGGDDSIRRNVDYDTGNFTESGQFYPNMRFADRQISYNVADECDDKKKREVDEAFDTIEDNTVLRFIREGNSAQIKVLCSEDAPEPEGEGHFVAGEGGPTEVINTTLYSVIFAGQMSLYRDDKCDTPHIALHEGLHVLGFDHNNNPKSILYSTLNCEQEVDDYIWREINRIYEDPGLADLKITDVVATKAGRYLNFDIEIVNQGLILADDVKLTVYGDDDAIEFKDSESGVTLHYIEIGDIKVGTTYTLRVDNARMSGRGVEEVRFVVDVKNEIDELFEDNNDLTLTV
ncbi:hypothetical protein COU62_00945 [Candidatus Pacearchaeota archaeon CG10_big_fil_rev_8_21_14_0_10_35_219]|nr:matrixin family metalloprotease [Candidatus Pacearchaeota archaeon]OIO43006.1 MAG: hypothetical protein AUJ63_01115 [Candidatus Pacearchaeota archaeon CG1_02_35_32]PIO08132.1 MAG: hypothetical protein COU62_00945 [Candidatus Pacearchaeota archaeon CG10_big_fil_rev_8_21_14_0_10_35_219]PIY81066.1 MAG: hypothetical protein COY79_04655 [Candidatus Pacearchaeota archaeon CG_4_10_14_0_8_um_filter_35_169]PIZ79938.1 MAG: hypothetical protein COY00_02965 [Candidatus Pacearchaeota archaeon CG_4_10_14_